METLESVLVFMVSMAERAGVIQMKYHGKAHDFDWITINNIRTEADKEVAELVWRLIGQRYSEYSVYTEEKGAKMTGHKRMFVVDELDGTNPFAWGFGDYFSFCIALFENAIPVLGVINAPKRGDMYVADGKSALCNGRSIGVNAIVDLSKVWMGIDGGKIRRTSDIPFIEKAKSDGGIAGIITGGCASVPLCLVADGRLHAYLGTDLEPEDVAATVPLIRGAGGKVTNFDGQDWQFGNRTILAANPVLHQRLFEFFGLPKTQEEVWNWTRQS